MRRTNTTQLALDLRQRAAMEREDFLVSPTNVQAVAWVDKWPDWPSPALVLVGPPGCGKTHLGQVWQKRAGASVFEPGGAVIREPIETPVFVDSPNDPAHDEEIFHLYNSIAASGKHLLVATEVPPVRWNGRLPDLKSRLSAAPHISIEAPNETLIAAVMMKMFADQQIDVGAEVISYLVNRMERSFEAARLLVDRLNNASLATKRRITVPLAREVIQTLPEQDKEI